MKMRYGLAICSTLLQAGWSLFPPPASAAEPVPFYLEYQAPPSCADENAWLRELTRRSSRVVLAHDGQAAPSLRVALAETEGRVNAELTVIDLDGRETKRTLSAASCSEAVEG